MVSIDSDSDDSIGISNGRKLEDDGSKSKPKTNAGDVTLKRHSPHPVELPVSKKARSSSSPIVICEGDFQQKQADHREANILEKNRVSRFDSSDEDDDIFCRSGSRPRTSHPQEMQPLSGTSNISAATLKFLERTRRKMDGEELSDSGEGSDEAKVESKSKAMNRGKKCGPSISSVLSKKRPSSSRVRTTRTSAPARNVSTDVSDVNEDYLMEKNEATTRTKKGRRLTDEEKRQREEEKRIEKEKRDAEKRIEKVKKAAAKERVAAEKASKAALDDANRNRTRNIEETLKEMIVDIQSTFNGHNAYHNLVDHIFPDNQIEFTTDEPPLVDLPVGNIISWRRRRKVEYDSTEEIFRPIPEVIERERHVLVFLTAVEYIELALKGYYGGLKNHTANIVSSHPKGAIPIYLIEGMAPLIRKIKTKNQRDWAAHVTGTAPSVHTTRRPPGSEKERTERIIAETTPEEAEESLLDIQFLPGSQKVFLMQTDSALQTAQSIFKLTQEVARAFYKGIEISMSHYGIERNSTCGTSPEDTLHKMLQEISRVTSGIATGVMSRATSVMEIVALCRKDGEGFVEGAKVGQLRDGTSAGGRKIGIGTSRRIYTVFMGQDPEEDDV